VVSVWDTAGEEKFDSLTRYTVRPPPINFPELASVANLCRDYNAQGAKVFMIEKRSAQWLEVRREEGSLL